MASHPQMKALLQPQHIQQKEFVVALVKVLWLLECAFLKETKFKMGFYFIFNRFYFLSRKVMYLVDIIRNFRVRNAGRHSVPLYVGQYFRNIQNYLLLNLNKISHFFFTWSWSENLFNIFIKLCISRRRVSSHNKGLTCFFLISNSNSNLNSFVPHQLREVSV